MRRRLYTLVLALLPRAFRARFGDDLLETAGAIDRDRPLRARQAPRVLADAVTTVVAIRRELRMEQRPAGSPARRSVMDGLWQDIRFAARGLRRDAAFTTFVVIALTLGIGANTAMFGIVDRLLLTGPPHITNPDAVVRVYLTGEPEGMRRFTTSTFGNVTYDLFRTQAQSFSSVATYAINDVIVGQGADATRVRGGYASETLFPLLGVRPSMGRFYTAAENGDTPARVVVLGYGAWQRWFGGASDVLGRQVMVAGAQYSVIGVAPRGFTGPQFGPADIWLPMNFTSVRTTPQWKTTWNAQWLRVVGRLRDGVTREQAGQELTAIYRRGYTGDETHLAKADLSVASTTASSAGIEAPEVTVVRWLAGVAFIVLVIACANVANLMLARGVRRTREVAVRAALGARRWRLVRLMLAEALMLAGAGAAGSILVAYGLGGLARRVVFSFADWSTPTVDGRVLMVSMALASAAGLSVGLLPAWRATRGNLTDGLKRSARDGRGQRSRLRHTLTIVQAALSVMLLVGAGLFLRSLWNVYRLPLGFDPGVVVAEIAWPGLGQLQDKDARAAEQLRRSTFSSDALTILRQIPGVEHASLAVGTPFGNRFSDQVRIPGVSKVPTLKTGGPTLSAVTDDYFATVGTRMLRGRTFTPADRRASEPVAIVSDTMAKTVWPGGDPIGQCIITGVEANAPCARIVGIAEDTHRGALREPPVMHYYIPFGQEVGFGGTAFLARAEDAASVGPAIRRALTQADSSIRFVTISTIQQAIDPEIKPWRIGAVVFSFSGLLALLVAAIGIYSVMSYLVADRTHEIGVRMALGARKGHVARLILGGSVGMAAIGVAGGLVASLSASRLIEPLLFNVSPRDPWVYGMVGVALLAVALCAGVIPTLRANRIDPLQALRVE